MAKKRSQHLEQVLRQRFADFVSSRGSRMITLLETVRFMRMRGWTAFVFGGIPRGVFDDGRRHQPRDLDLVFDDEHFSFFESAFGHHILRRNNYGGLRLHVEKLVVDAWPLSATWAFREGHVQKPSFENLPSTTFLNIDGVIIEAAPVPGKRRRIYEAGFFSAWNERTLDINLRENPFPAICVTRTLHISKRLGFKLSQRLAMYLWETLEARPAVEFEKAQLSHYGRIEFEAHQLRAIHDRLEKHLAGAALFPVALFSLRPDQMEFRLKSNAVAGTRATAHDDLQATCQPVGATQTLPGGSRAESKKETLLWKRPLDGFAESLMCGSAC